MPATLKDIASEAGVSWQVVATVLRGRGSARASAETTQRIRRLATEMDYRPHAAARSLVSGKSRNIEMHEYGYDIAHNQITRVHLPIVASFSHYCRERRYNLLLVTGPNLDTDDRLRGLRERNVDAMVHLSVADFTMLDAARAAGIVSLCVSPQLPVGDIVNAGYPVFNFDNEGGMRAIMEPLIALGHRDFGFVRGKSTQSDFDERWLACLDIMAAHGLPVREEWVWKASPRIQNRGDCAAIAERIAAESRRPTAIVCSNDPQAVCLMQTLQEAGLRIPDDLSVTGYDDQDVALLLTPTLTTVVQDWNEFSRQAAGHLFSLLVPEGSDQPQSLYQRFPVKLIERGSCGPPPPR